MTKFLYIIGLLLLTAMSIKAQQTPKMSAYILRGSITNGDDATAVVGATVRLFQQNKLVGELFQAIQAILVFNVP